MLMQNVREISLSPVPESIGWRSETVQVSYPEFHGLHAYSLPRFCGLHPKYAVDEFKRFFLFLDIAPVKVDEATGTITQEKMRSICSEIGVKQPELDA